MGKNIQAFAVTFCAILSSMNIFNECESIKRFITKQTLNVKYLEQDKIMKVG